MGEHKHKPPVQQMVVTDLDAVGKILVDEKIYCEQCGAAVPLWPPEELREHTMATHPDSFWSAIAEAWQNYKNDTDLARRANFLNRQRVEYVLAMLQHRRDLYEKLVEAGVIRAPAQG